VADLDALAGAGKQHRVFAHDVAAAHGGKADAAAHAFAGVAMAREHALVARSTPRARATASPMASAVPLGASTLCLWWASITSTS
jgi:hypothetical protein